MDKFNKIIAPFSMDRWGGAIAGGVNEAGRIGNAIGGGLSGGLSKIGSFFNPNPQQRSNTLKTVGNAVAPGLMNYQNKVDNAIQGNFKHGGKVKKTGIYRLHQGERVLNKKQEMARKMSQ